MFGDALLHLRESALPPFLEVLQAKEVFRFAGADHRLYDLLFPDVRLRILSGARIGTTGVNGS